jgi:hypothetical protein
MLPRLAPLLAVVVAIALGDLAFLMLRLTRSAPLLCRRLILVEDRLLRERRLGRNKVDAFQLQRQDHIEVKSESPRRSSHDKRQIKLAEKTDNLHISLFPHWGASGAFATADTSRSLSRSLAPRDAKPRTATEAPAW